LEAVIAHQTKQMNKICELFAPTPFKLKYERMEEEEKDKLLVSWENEIPLLMRPSPVDFERIFCWYLLKLANFRLWTFPERSIGRQSFGWL